MPISIIQSIPTNQTAFDTVHPELVAMREEEVDREARASPVHAASIAEAAAGKLSHHRPQIVLLLGETAAVRVDRLPIYARALKHAAAEAQVNVMSGDLSALHEAARASHTLIMTELESAALRGHLDASVLEPARPIQGYAETINSTTLAVLIAHQNWPALEGHTHLTPEMLDAATLAVERLDRAIIDRDHGVSRTPAVELRTRALSKLLSEYDEVRRIATYVRWHQRDYDELAPSVFAGRGRRAGGEEEEPEVTPPVTPGPTDSGPFSG